MKVLFDTSVLVAASVEDHTKHNVAISRLNEVRREGQVFVSSHSQMELFAVLTSLPLSPRISPGTARRLIGKNLEETTLVDYAEEDYRKIIDMAAEQGITGGTIYDLLIAFAGIKENVDRLITLNISDFERCLAPFDLNPSHP
jgi:predicted nucleic acid-binding protein